MGFSSFVNNYNGTTIDFDTIFDFLYTKYFPRAIFGPIYLTSKKYYFFIANLDFIGFTRGINSIRPSTKYRDRILN